jgi:hypothetical protein
MLSSLLPSAHTSTAALFEKLQHVEELVGKYEEVVANKHHDDWKAQQDVRCAEYERAEKQKLLRLQHSLTSEQNRAKLAFRQESDRRRRAAVERVACTRREAAHAERSRIAATNTRAENDRRKEVAEREAKSRELDMQFQADVRDFQLYGAPRPSTRSYCDG